MIFVERLQKNPYFNIAAEEFILKNFSDEVMMLWQSEPSVVIGKHQNTLAEVNLDFVTKNNIPVIRRISGGGTVYHDGGNINYTVITSNKNREMLIDFTKFTLPIIEFLKTIGIESSFEGKNNLVTDGKKISGNSAHVFKNRVMHHGTLLFSTDLDKLDRAIRPSNTNIEDKAVQSIRAAVTNLSAHLNQKLEINEFKAKLQKYLVKYHDISYIHTLSKGDVKNIKKLISDKYALWRWNFGYSPKYIFKNTFADLNLIMEVKNGVIEKAEISGDSSNSELISGDHFVGLMHSKTGIRDKLNELETANNITGFYIGLFGY